MKFNGNIVKIVIAIVVILGAIFWAFTGLQTTSYSGTSLDFPVGSGIVKITNPSDEPVAVVLTSEGTRSFVIDTEIEGVSGSAERIGSGNTRTYVFEFDLPPGTHEFSIDSNGTVNLTTDNTVTLDATVSPMTQETSRATIIGTLIVVLGALFYISHTTKHVWMKYLRGTVSTDATVEPATTAPPLVTDNGQGKAARSYGDNRS